MIPKVTFTLLILCLVFTIASCSRTIPKQTPAPEETTAAKDTQSEGAVPQVTQDETASPQEGTAEYYIAKLDSETKEARLEAVQKLKEMGDKAGNAVDALIKALRFDTDKDIRSGAADALAAIGEKAKSSIPILISGLKDEAWEVRMHVAKALGSFKAAARDALNALNATLNKETVEDVKREIEAAVKTISDAVKSEEKKTSEKDIQPHK